MKGDACKAIALHVIVIAALFALNFVLPPYHHGVLARVMVLAVFAMGYNLLFGYAGLLSLGHAMFFAAGLYGAGLPMVHFGWGVPGAFAAGLLAGVLLSAVIGLLALRTKGVAFMIVTMMFAQVGYLLVYYFGSWTRGDEGLVIQQQARAIQFGATRLDLTNPVTRYMAALALFAIVLIATLIMVRSSFGRVLVAIRENEERTRMLGYDTFANKLAAMVASGAICAAAGAAYVILFGYVGSTFASIQYSILPLLWVLLGGAATTLGPLVGTVLMFYLIDGSGDLLKIYAPGWNISYLGIVGVALILLVLFFPKGILGTIRDRWARWLP
ncbi:MAG: branched-chain amino acid ABC transporter permease [Mesorhizobium sp.]|nr:branched-chain amino acid ABC transporter permease [Mesorhizobium sp.]MBL8576905.1 branched-chain amino acid ABC transporter permease [Mesorhizobium sp.]